MQEGGYPIGVHLLAFIGNKYYFYHLCMNNLVFEFEQVDEARHGEDLT